jgi:hypothetical protein
MKRIKFQPRVSYSKEMGNRFLKNVQTCGGCKSLILLNHNKYVHAGFGYYCSFTCYKDTVLRREKSHESLFGKVVNKIIGVK